MKLKNKIKAYFEKLIIQDLNRSRCFPHEEISEEEKRRLLYYIEFHEEIIKEYGSYDNWKRVLERDNMKPNPINCTLSFFASALEILSIAFGIIYL